MVFHPGDPWPSDTPGGVSHRAWGGYIRFWLMAAISGGFPFTAGPHQNDRLNAGNVLTDTSGFVGGRQVDPQALPTTSGLWVDLTCDLVDCDIANGATSGAGILSKAEAGTLTATLYDPTGKYDPANPSSPFALNGRSRLVPGVPILAFCEIIRDPTAATVQVWQVPLFSGTADRWSEAWDREPSDRRGKLVATDFVKQLVKMNRAAQPPAGAGESVQSRLGRISTYYAFNGLTHYAVPPSAGGEGTRTLQATTLAQSAWELINRAIDDDLGFVWWNPGMSTIYGAGGVWVSRESWSYVAAGFPKPLLGCGGAGFLDIVTEAIPMAFDAQLVNAAYASRSGGTSQSARNTASINRWGEQSVSRSDLGLNDDPQVATWAQDLVNLEANPRGALERVTLIPAVAPQSWDAWRQVLPPSIVTGPLRVVYENESFDYVADVTVRNVGYEYHIAADDWSVVLHTVSANMASGANTLHAGPHALDRLDAGNVAA